MEKVAVGQRAKTMGRSGILALILLLLGVIIVWAGIFAIMTIGLEGNVKEIPAPSMTDVSTNDDGVVDFSQFDPYDDGTDPSGPVEAGGAPRFTYNMQNCTAIINGTGNVDVTMVDTYHTAYCSVRISVVNDTSDVLYLVDAIFDGVAPLSASLNSASACGYLLNPSETGNVIVDIWPVEGASGSWTKAENQLDVRWGLEGTFTCP